jgi:hypothetical protein
VSLILIAATAFSHGIAVPPATAEQAVERQRQEVREAIDSSPCRSGATDEEIVVCGRLYSALPTRAARSGLVPSSVFSAPVRGPWFEYRRGPLSLSCCSIDGSRGSGAGLGLRLRF